jgi:hypothetical protein
MAPSKRRPQRRRRTRRPPPGAALGAQLATLLDWEKAHAGFEAAVADVPIDLRGKRPPGLPHSLWQLLEHLRLCQWDILDYCVSSEYREGAWPDDYWPETAEPPTPTAWDESVAGFRRDLANLKRLATDPKIDLLGPLPYAREATYLRELLLVADHNAYHVGQMILVRRLLGIWKA